MWSSARRGFKRLFETAAPLPRDDATAIIQFGERLQHLPFTLARRSVLCLHATDDEVRAFISQGAFAVGLAFEPTAASPYQINGKVHRLQFAAASIDVVYLGRAGRFDPAVLPEVQRVLPLEGLLIAELPLASADMLLPRILASGFRLELRTSFDAPAPGVNVVFRKSRP